MAVILLAVLGGVCLERATRPEAASLEPQAGCQVLDREGRLLRLAPEPNGRRLLKLPEGPLPPLVAAAFVAAEDQRFFRHGGVDAQAVGRALMANLAAGRIVSGASTITQQLARLTRPAPRTYYHKTLEMLRAVRLELALEKTEILRYYLNRAPLSHNLMGVETGALGYFGKPAARLGASQAAMLAALVKAPSALNPYGPRRERLLGRRNWVLARMAHLGFLSPEECSQAQAEPLGVQTATGRPGPVFPFEAPHLVEMVLSGLNRQAMPADGVIRTSIDLSLQRQAEAVVRSQQARLKPGRASQAAAVIVDNRGGEILALVGSFAYEKHSLGFNNGATARRSPGSALKPFLYALALDEGLTPAMLLEDIERRYRIPRGEFIPANFDRFPHGPVSFREALGNSLNLSAVHLLELVGPASYYDTLYRLGLINRPERGPGHYGLGLVVGNPEVSLLQLAAAYAALANGGRYQPLRWRAGEERPPPEPLFSPQAAYIVTDILADPLARARSFGGSQAMNPSPRPALKTGTSTRYRDCWAVAYTPAYTVGVWVGNFDGRPTAKLSGASAAAPVAAELAALLFPLGPPAAFRRPPGVAAAPVCTFSGLTPGPHCRHHSQELFIHGTEPRERCSLHPQEHPWHRLPTVYAGWLHQRFRGGGAGRYRLEGFDPNLKHTFGPGAAGFPTPAAKPLRTAAPAATHPARTGTPNPTPRLEAAAAGFSTATFQTRPAPELPVCISYPLPGDHFLLTPPAGTLEVTVQALCRAPLPHLTWLVNGREVGTVGPPYTLTLSLPRGRHQLTALGPDNLGNSIDILVQ